MLNYCTVAVASYSTLPPSVGCGFSSLQYFQHNDIDTRPQAAAASRPGWLSVRLRHYACIPQFILTQYAPIHSLRQTYPLIHPPLTLSLTPYPGTVTRCVGSWSLWRHGRTSTAPDSCARWTHRTRSAMPSVCLSARRRTRSPSPSHRWTMTTTRLPTRVLAMAMMVEVAI